MFNHFDYFSENLSCADTNRDELISKFEVLSFKKGQFLMEANDVCDHIMFVAEGCLLVKIDKDDENVMIREIVTPGFWLTDIHSFLEKKPSNLSIVALNETTVFALKREDYEYVKIHFPRFVEMALEVVGKVNKSLENRWFSFSNMTAEEKTEWYFSQKRFQRFEIPKKTIAQYLGIRPETFSRILKKMN